MSDRDTHELQRALDLAGLDAAEGTTLARCADYFLESEWLAARDESVRSAALAPVLALADEWEAEQPQAVPWEQGGRSGTIRQLRHAWQTARAKSAAQLRAACTLTAAHDHDTDEEGAS